MHIDYPEFIRGLEKELGPLTPEKSSMFIKSMRDKYGIGVFDARRHVRTEVLHRMVDRAETVDDLKNVLHKIID